MNKRSNFEIVNRNDIMCYSAAGNAKEHYNIEATESDSKFSVSAKVSTGKRGPFIISKFSVEVLNGFFV